MKKIVIMIGVILCLFGLTSCTQRIKQIKIYGFWDSTPAIIKSKNEIKKIKKMVLNQKYKEDTEGLFEKDSLNESFWLFFLDNNDQIIGKSENYIIKSSGYVFYIDDVNGKEIVYISKEKIDYKKFLSMIV